MDFYLTKILSFPLEPLNMLFLLLVVGLYALWMGRMMAARIIITAVAGLFLFFGSTSVADFILSPLEQRFPSRPVPVHVDGIIMLGGAQNAHLSAYHHQPVLNGAAERMTTFVALARDYPDARLVFSGGSGSIRYQAFSEGDTVRMFLRQQGIDSARVTYEETSRNTYENVVNTLREVKPQNGETWLLVTSAADIPRAMGVFRMNGWAVIPVPCDYNAAAPVWQFEGSMTRSFEKLSRATHEWIGLVAYYLQGRSSSLFPHP